MLQELFIISQSILLLFLVVHDWVDVAPFNDLLALHSNGTKKMVVSTLTNCTRLFSTKKSVDYIGLRAMQKDEDRRRFLSLQLGHL